MKVSLLVFAPPALNWQFIAYFKLMFSLAVHSWFSQIMCIHLAFSRLLNVLNLNTNVIFWLRKGQCYVGQCVLCAVVFFVLCDKPVFSACCVLRLCCRFVFSVAKVSVDYMGVSRNCLCLFKNWAFLFLALAMLSG